MSDFIYNEKLKKHDNKCGLSTILLCGLSTIALIDSTKSRLTERS